jgi:hypothetical protein
MPAFSKCCHAQKIGAKVERHSAETVALQTMTALGQKGSFGIVCDAPASRRGKTNHLIRCARTGRLANRDQC